MSGFTTWLKSEMPMISGLVQAALALAATFDKSLTAGQTGAIEAAVAAVGALIVAFGTRPFQVSVLTGATQAVILLLVAFHIHGVQPGLVGTVNAAIVFLASLLVRQHVSPSSADARTMLKKYAVSPPPTPAAAGHA
jgi:MFS-type transporter involved in bile tolerance (Atg22 family)